jgi:hypothetical protein
METYNANVYTLLCICEALQPEDDPMWLKLAAEINTRDNIVVLMDLYSFIL